MPGLVPEGFGLLVGAPKVGKSWYALDMLLSVAAGGRTLGQLAVGAARRVLYLALEDGDRRMQDRCRQLLAQPHRPDEPIPPLFCYLTRIEPGAVVPTIEAFLAAYPDTALVVVDTLGKVMPPPAPNETTYMRDYRVGGRLKAIADARPGLAIVALHHDRKAGSDDFVERVSGTNGLAGAADVVAVLDRKRQSTDGMLLVTGRDIPDGAYAITMSGVGRWTLDGADLDAAAQKARQRAAATEGLSDLTTSILAFVDERGETSRGDVVEKFGEHAGRYLARLVDSGRLVRVGRGRYTVPDVPVSQPSQVSFSQVSAGADTDTGAGRSVPNGGAAVPLYPDQDGDHA